MGLFEKAYVVKKIFFVLTGLIVSASVAAGGLERTDSPPDAAVYFISPADGDEVAGTFTVRFGLKGMGVAPAGVEKANTGHHHLIVDGELPALDKPMGGDVMHFGGGQTEVSLTLPAGEHTLQLILGDRFHIPHSPPVVSEKITVTVR